MIVRDWYYTAEDLWEISYDPANYMLGIDGILDGGNVLPGFTLAVRDIFAD